MDELKQARDAVASAIGKLQSFTGTAGSVEMRQVQAALDYCGYAYAVLEDRDDTNPAWSS